MLFNSFDFAVFLPIVFSIYWLVGKENIKLQNLVVVGASYLFYGWWDYRFLSLIVLSTIVDFIVGRSLGRVQKAKPRRNLLTVSILFNLGILGFFKYYDFFADNFVTAFSFFGQEITPRSLHIILPVGISFYTFQTMSYTIDVYKRKLEPTNDFIAFSAFVSFFPQLVAGPIERGINLLPQFIKQRNFSYLKAKDGMQQILWGFFKKIVIADNCAIFANQIFNNSLDYNGSALLLGTFFFAFQIYGDFSGYSDIAIGTSRLFGFNLMKNFAFPYFSRDIAEFWRRWHISLSTWFRDYLYIPLGGSQGNVWKSFRNIFIVFLVSGFWHGANWTFVAWGFLNALFFLPLFIVKKNRENLNSVAEGRLFPTISEFLSVLVTFILTTFAWIFFRSESIGQAFEIYSQILSTAIFSLPNLPVTLPLVSTVMLVLVFIVVEWLGRENQYAIQTTDLGLKKFGKYVLYYAIIFTILVFGNFEENQFIYFQF